MPAVESGVSHGGPRPGPEPEPHAAAQPRRRQAGRQLDRDPGRGAAGGEVSRAAARCSGSPPRDSRRSSRPAPGVAFYRMCRQGDLLVISGGELGEMSGFDIAKRLSLTFPGSASSQVNALEPVPGSPGKFLAIRNNAPGFAVLDFDAASPRTAETKRVDLGAPARLGALRFNRERDVDPRPALPLHPHDERCERDRRLEPVGPDGGRRRLEGPGSRGPVRRAQALAAGRRRSRRSSSTRRRSTS